MNGKAVSNQENPAKELAPSAVSKLGLIFGEQAKISFEDGRYVVDSILKDGMCPGGQKIHVELQETDSANKDTYKASVLIVDGLAIHDEIKLGYFFRVPAKAEMEDNPGIPEHLKKFIGTKGYDNGTVLLKSLDDADGLVALFHEIGHALDKRPVFTVNAEVDKALVEKYLNRDDKESVFSPEELADLRQSGENILDVEMYANKMAIQCVNFFRNKGHNLFEKDEDLSLVKNFLVTITALRYQNSLEFVELVGRERIDELLML